MKFPWPWLLAALSGILLALCYPPFDQEWLCWIALTPLISALWFGPAGGRWAALRRFGLGCVAGLAFFWASLYWLTEVTGLGWFILAFYLALYPGAWALFIATVARPRDSPTLNSPCLRSWDNLRLALLGAAAWTAIEWVRGTLFTGFGWNALAVTLHRNIALIQIADLTGIGGISFLIALANLIAVLTVKRLTLELGRMRVRPHYDFTATLALIAIAFSYGVHCFYRDAGPTIPLKIAAVQANIPQSQKWDPAFELHITDVYQRQSEVAISLDPDLLIWPEAATPQPMLSNEQTRDDVTAILREHGGDFLLGTVYFATNQAFNSAVLLHPDGGAQLYNKIHLVPFGEFIPFRESFPLFAWIVGDQVPGDFDAGVEAVALELSTKPVRLAPLICFEDTLGDLARQFAARRAQLLVTLTNDGWFRKSAGSRQHLANAIFRCAETKLPMVRAANTGVTCFIDRLGRVTQTLESGDGDTFIEGVLFGTVQVPAAPAKTFYTRHGDLFALGCVFASLAAIQAHLVTSRRHSPVANS